MLTFYFFFFFFNVKGITLRTTTSSSISPTQLPTQKQGSKAKEGLRSTLVPGLGPRLSGSVSTSRCRKAATALSAGSAGLASQPRTFTPHARGPICSSAGRQHHLSSPNLNILSMHHGFTKGKIRITELFLTQQSCEKVSVIHT